MKGNKHLKYFIYIFICLLLVSCSAKANQKHVQNSKEFIRYTTDNKLKDINVIKDDDKIKRIKGVIKNIEWSDSVFERGDNSYSFWIEKKGVKERLGMYDVWFNKPKTMIFDEKNGKYGFLTLDDTMRLKEIFKWQ
jgi:hypothetical protein